MRRRALLPLKKYKDFQTATEAWLGAEVLLDDATIRELQENALSSAWRWWLENQDLSEWSVEGDEFVDHASAFMVRTAIESLFCELADFIIRQLRVSVYHVDYVGISFDNISIDYVTVRNRNDANHSRRPAYRFGSLV